MSLLKIKRMSFAAALLAVAVVHGPSVQACDDAVKAVAVVKVSTSRPTPSVEELVSRLESLVQPVTHKVTLCNSELAQAQAQVESLSASMVAVSADQSKSLRSLKLLKQALEQPGCTINIGDECYTRETVGAAIEVKLADHRKQTTKIGCLTKELALAQQNLEKVAAKVARWVAKEKELLAQIESLETLAAQKANDMASMEKQVSLLIGSIDNMFQRSTVPASAATPVSTASTSPAPRPLTKPEAELVAEVDQVLSQK